MSKKQIDLLDEIIVDNFAGGVEINTMEELEKAVLKMRRVLVGTTPLTQGEARALINEEVADVLNCVEALEAISFLDRAHVSRIQAGKLERWDRRTREGVT